jgi:hypothetical protein
LVALGIAVFKYIFREDQPLLNITDVIVGSLIFIWFVPSINLCDGVFSDQTAFQFVLAWSYGGKPRRFRRMVLSR